MKATNYLSILGLALLTSCAAHRDITPPPGVTPDPSKQPHSSTDQTQKNPASSISSWTLSGAMAAKNNSTHKGWSASLNWTQLGLNTYHIRLNGPLGGGTVLIDKNGGVVTYADGPKKVSSANADQLLFQQTGIRLPVNNLYYWVRGIPAPGKVASTHFDSQHNLVSLTQSGYTINYASYTTVGNVDLPSKIRLQGQGSLIKLIIKHWTM